MIINKRLLSAFMVICMILALLPMNSKRTLAEEAPVEYYELWVGGVQVTSKNKDNITGPGISGSVSYIPETQTLAVSSAAITGVYSGVTLDGWPFKSAIYATGPLKIVLTGNNTMSVVSEKNIDNYGIYSLGNITIYGTGSLDVNNYINEVQAPISIAIHSTRNITIDSGTVTASSSNAEFKSSAIGGNEVKISGGTVKVTARSGINGSIGIYGDSGVTIEGGLVEATADTKYDSSYVYGIAAGYKEVIIISGGNVTASSKATTGTNGAIDGDFKPSNGTISASTNSDGTEADIYDPAQLKNYKYIHYEVNPDIALVAAAKEAIEGGSYTMTQAVANTEAGVKAELARQMNGLSGMSGTGITVADGDVTVTSFTPAVAGTSANPAGTNGSITFTVALSKGTVTDITTSLTGVITATAYDGITNAQAVAAAKAVVVDGTVTVVYGAGQAAKTGAVQSYVNGLLIGVGDAAGVTANVIHISDNTYEVELSKGSVSDSKTITMIINEGANPDIALVAAAKEAIEGGSYTMTQADANTEAGVKAELARQMNGLSGMSETGVTVADDDITVTSFTPAVAGTSANPAGTNGSISFTVALSKGIVTDITTSLTGVITATAYDGITDDQAVAAAKAAVVEGTVTVVFGADQAAKTGAVQSYVNGLLIGVGDAAGVTATVTHISDNTYEVELSKGSVSDSKTITMIINEGANPDIALVAAAKEAIEGGSYTMTQVIANTEAGVKAELARQMNGLSGMSGTGITVAAADITVSSLIPAVAGTSANPVGTNGSITFTVALSKGTVTDTTTSLSGVITATAYRPIEPPIQPPVQPPISVPISPTPTPTPAPKVSLKITEDNIQVEVELTSDVIEYYDGQITLPIASEEILNELEKDELSGVRVGLNLTEQSDDADQQEINFILESEVLQKAKENNKDITVDVKDSTNKVLYSWTFDKAELSNSDKEVKDVNLSLKVEKASEDAHLLDAQKDNKDSVALVIGFAHEGLLPSQASVKIYVGNQEGIIPGTKVYLYHYNENIGKLETIPYGYQATVDEAGYITINILQCSDYVVFTKEADSKQFVSLRNQIKVTPTKISLSLTEGKNSSKITVKLPVTLEWVRSLNEPTSQSAIGGVTIKFTSSDNQIAKVDSQGNITAKSPGEVVINTTITLYNKKTKKIELLVKVKP